MATTKCKDINFGGLGSSNTGVTYFDADEAELRAQPGAAGLQSVNVIVTESEKGVAPQTSATVRIAVDVEGNQLRDRNHLVALPCPPYCGQG